MITRIVAACARRPYVVLAAAALMAAAGYASQRGLARDAIPDLSNPQLVLVAEWMGHPAPEVAAQVTEVLTGALEGVPGSTTVRGSSMADMAYVDVEFRSEAALPAGRAEIVRRIDALRPRLPAAVHIQVGPEASATGWVLQYALRPPEGKKAMPMGEAKHRGPGAEIRPLREFQDKVLRPALVGIPGVAEVATLGGEREEVVVQTTDAELRAAGAAFSDVATALRARLKHLPRPTAAHDLEHDPVLGKLTRVSVQPAMSGGAADVNGWWPIVVGIVIVKRGADPTAVIAQRQAGHRARAQGDAPDGETGRALRPFGAGGAGREDAAARGRRGGGRRGAGGADVPAPRSQRAGADGDVAARRAADVRSDAPVRHPRHDHEPGRHRHRARNGGRRRAGGAGSVPPATGDGARRAGPRA